MMSGIVCIVIPTILLFLCVQVVTVKEEWIAISILRLVECEKAVVEGAGATALAAILSGELPELKGKRLVSVFPVEENCYRRLECYLEIPCFVS